jgi:polar amino acid transport system substrate-binding protein
MQKNKQMIKFMVLLAAVVSILVSLGGCTDGTTATIQSASDLNSSSYTISVDSGSAAANTAMEQFSEAKIVYAASASDAYLSVSQGKTDAFVYGRLFMQYALSSGTLDNLCILDDTLDTADIAVGISKSQADLLPEVNAFIAESKESGLLDEMYDRWVLQSDPEMPEIAAVENPERTIKIGTSGLVEPVTYYDKDGALTGYDVELIYRLAVYLNAKVEIEAMSYDALIASLESGRLDAVIADLNVTDERKQVILMSDPYRVSETAVVVRKDMVSANAAAAVTDTTDGGGDFWSNLQDSFQRTFIEEGRWKLILTGLLVTVELSAASLVLGAILGFFFSMVLRSKNQLVRSVGNGLSTLLNGMPILIILMIFYYIIFSKTTLPAMVIGIFAFSIDFANVVAGLLNTGIFAVEQGQQEAAEAMGYTKWQVFRKITFPQAARQMSGQFNGAVINLIKGTSVVGYITVQDLTQVGDIIRSRTYEAFFPLIAIAIIYFLLAHLFVTIIKRFEIRLDPKRRPRRVKGVKSND